ncbi:MAG: DUF6445 family protein [Dokdonella sp.]
MPTSLIIVDDFLDRPDELRNAALRLTYPPQEGAFPGRNSLQRINLEGLERQVSHLVAEPVVPISPLESHAKCRITLAADRGRGKVHVDRSHWSGILYLSRPENCRGGTEFFRHRPTGTERAPLNQEEALAMGLSSMSDVQSKIIEKDSNDDSKWELTMRVPMRFNRLILLRPWLWHTAGEAFGDRIENGRLIYLMFFSSQR